MPAFGLAILLYYYYTIRSGFKNIPLLLTLTRSNVVYVLINFMSQTSHPSMDQRVGEYRKPIKDEKHIKTWLPILTYPYNVLSIKGKHVSHLHFFKEAK